MDINVARHVIRVAFRSGRELETLLDLLQEHSDAQEYKTYAKAIATAIASIHLEIVNRVMSSYPSLRKNLKRQLRSTGAIFESERAVGRAQ